MATTKAYSKDQAEAYDARHFGGRSGQYILERDCEAVASLLGPARGVILDIPCGTGAYMSVLRERGYKVIAADASLPMLEVVGRRAPGVARVLCDINRLPFRADAFKGVLTLRLFSHYAAEDVRRMLQELGRTASPGGPVVFDTFGWSPRHWPLLRSFLKPAYIEILRPRVVEELIHSAGLSEVDSRQLYLFSPLWQRRLPLWLLRGLTAVEKRLPARWRLRTLWACTRE